MNRSNLISMADIDHYSVNQLLLLAFLVEFFLLEVLSEIWYFHCMGLSFEYSWLDNGNYLVIIVVVFNKWFFKITIDLLFYLGFLLLLGYFALFQRLFLLHLFLFFWFLFWLFFFSFWTFLTNFWLLFITTLAIYLFFKPYLLFGCLTNQTSYIFNLLKPLFIRH